MSKKQINLRIVKKTGGFVVMNRISFVTIVSALLLCATTRCIHKKDPEVPVQLISNEALFLERLNTIRDTPVQKFSDSVSLILKDTVYFPALHSFAFGAKVEDPYEKRSYYFLLLRDRQDPMHCCFIPCSFPNLSNTCYPNMFYMHNVAFHDLNQYLNELKSQDILFSSIDSLFRMAHGYAHEIGVDLAEGKGIPQIRTTEEIDRYRFEMDSTRLLNIDLLKMKLQDKNFRLYYYRGALESIELINTHDYGMMVCDTTPQFKKRISSGPKQYMVFHMKWN